MLLTWLNKYKWRIIGSALVVGAIALHIYRPDLAGFNSDSTTNTERDKAGETIKTVEIEQSGKTLWDLLSVLGVPLSLALLGYWFQRREQKRADERAEQERKRAEQQAQLERDAAKERADLELRIATDNQREEALQAYFDRLSTLLVDKNLIAVSTKLEQYKKDLEKPLLRDEKYLKKEEYVSDNQELLDAAVNVIRARTLSILRQFGKDGDRKSSVIRFLVETEVVRQLKVDLGGADLSDVNLDGIDLTHARFEGANLSGASLNRVFLGRASLDGVDLSGANLNHAILNQSSLKSITIGTADLKPANLSFAKLNGANLSLADLSDADLIDADLSGAFLNRTNLSSANLCNANLRNANLKGANLRGADLSKAINWTEKQLSSAQLCETKLPKGCNLKSNRDCKEPGIQ